MLFYVKLIWLAISGHWSTSTPSLVPLITLLPILLYGLAENHSHHDQSINMRNSCSKPLITYALQICFVKKLMCEPQGFTTSSVVAHSLLLSNLGYDYYISVL